MVNATTRYRSGRIWSLATRNSSAGVAAASDMLVCWMSAQIGHKLLICPLGSRAGRAASDEALRIWLELAASISPNDRSPTLARCTCMEDSVICTASANSANRDPAPKLARTQRMALIVPSTGQYPSDSVTRYATWSTGRRHGTASLAGHSLSSARTTNCLTLLSLESLSHRQSDAHWHSAASAVGAATVHQATGVYDARKANWSVITTSLDSPRDFPFHYRGRRRHLFVPAAGTLPEHPRFGSHSNSGDYRNRVAPRCSDLRERPGHGSGLLHCEGLLSGRWTPGAGTFHGRRVQLGDINYLLLLNAQQTYQQALLNVVIARANRFADTAALFQALGGGWWNNPNAPPERELTIADFFR